MRPGPHPMRTPQIATSVEGSAANLGKGFGHKGGYLCVSTAAPVW